MQLAYWKR